MKRFGLLRYVIYGLLGLNTWLFLQEDLTSAVFTHSEGLKLSDIASVFSASIDTLAWLILLLLLELETAVLPNIKQRPWVDRLTDGLAILCGIAILYALYGYISALSVPFGFSVTDVSDPCSLADTGATIAFALDEYVAIDLANCATLVGEIQFNSALNMYATREAVREIEFLSWIDVVNASVWVLVVIVLQLEIYLHSSKYFGTRFYFGYKSGKVALYAVLFVCAALWWIYSAPLDGWDALLWLFAFFFIEVNLIKWQEEAAAERERLSARTATLNDAEGGL